MGKMADNYSNRGFVAGGEGNFSKIRSVVNCEERGIDKSIRG